MSSNTEARGQQAGSEQTSTEAASAGRIAGRKAGSRNATGSGAPTRPPRRFVPSHTIVPNTIDPHQVLIAPIVSEKSLDLSKTGQFAFRVAMTANKIEIRRAIEKVFPRVHVTAVNTLIVRGKMQRRTTKGRRVQGYKPNWKKAIVTLAPGETLPIFENL